MQNRPFQPSYRDVSPDVSYLRARYANVALGLWLFVSAFLWPHFEASQANTWIVGLLICASSLAARRTSKLRWANTILSSWLFISTLLFVRPVGITTLWNNLLVAGAVFTFSLVAAGPTATAPPASLRGGAGAGPISSRQNPF